MNKFWADIIIAAIGAVVSVVTTIKQNRKTRKEVKSEINNQTETNAGISNSEN